MSKAKPADTWQDPGVRNYWLLSLGALLVLTLTLVMRNLGAWSLLPILIGSLSLAFRWRSGPVLVLVALGWVLFSERVGLSPLDLIERLFVTLVNLLSLQRSPYPPAHRIGLGARFVFSDILLCGAGLAYCAAHYRLAGLTNHIFPPDRRRQPGARPGWVHHQTIDMKRSERTFTPQEIVLLLVSVPGWVGLASIAWVWLMNRRPPVPEWPSTYWQLIYPELARSGERVVIELPAALWRGMLLVWLLGVGLIVIGGMISYLGQRRLSPPEAALVLQDTVWRETCREQRLLYRWLVWGRLRRQRREGKP